MDNTFVRELPGDPERQNGLRQVRAAQHSAHSTRMFPPHVFACGRGLLRQPALRSSDWHATPSYISALCFMQVFGVPCAGRASPRSVRHTPAPAAADTPGTSNTKTPGF